MQTRWFLSLSGTSLTLRCAQVFILSNKPGLDEDWIIWSDSGAELLYERGQSLLCRQHRHNRRRFGSSLCSKGRWLRCWWMLKQEDTDLLQSRLFGEWFAISKCYFLWLQSALLFLSHDLMAWFRYCVARLCHLCCFFSTFKLPKTDFVWTS